MMMSGCLNYKNLSNVWHQSLLYTPSSRHSSLAERGFGFALQGPHVQRVRMHKKVAYTLFHVNIRCIKSEMTVEMCGASRQLQVCRTHFSTAVDSLDN